MKKLTLLGTGLMLVASASLASNTGFKLNYPLPLQGGGKSNNFMMSFPSFYFPNGNVSTVGLQNSIDACKDLNDIPSTSPVPNPPPKVATLIRYDSAQDRPVPFSCAGTKSPFDIEPGLGYAVIPSAAAVVVNVVGSNDDALTSNKGTTRTTLTARPAPNSNNYWISFPYHLKSNNTIEVCTELNTLTSNKIATIAKFDSVQDRFIPFTCGGTKGAFDINPGEGYVVIPNATADIAFDVY